MWLQTLHMQQQHCSTAAPSPLHCVCAGVGAARAAGVAGPLADALFISARILRERDLEHEHLTALTAVWGQLVSHDIAYTLPISGDTTRSVTAIYIYPLLCTMQATPSAATPCSAARATRSVSPS